MTLRDLINQASSIKEELLDKEILIKSVNGNLIEPKLKFVTKDNEPLLRDNIQYIIIW